MKKTYPIYIPTIKKATIDLRRWYYVNIDGEKMSWWCLEWEINDIIKDYSNNKIQFEKVPFYKTIIR